MRPKHRVHEVLAEGAGLYFSDKHFLHSFLVSGYRVQHKQDKNVDHSVFLYTRHSIDSLGERFEAVSKSTGSRKSTLP